MDHQTAVAEMRRFNRFYTRKLGLLAQTFHGSPFTMTEGRVLFEIGRVDGGDRSDVTPAGSPPAVVAADIAVELGVDPAYLARIVKRFVADRLVVQRPDPVDRRRRFLSLTEAGREALARLQAAADDEIGTLLAGLDDRAVETLAEAQGQVIGLLGGVDGTETVLRPHRPGDIGWVIERQARLYAREYGWNDEYEALACEICGQFLRDFKPGKEFCWIAERNGHRAGAVFLVQRNEEEGQLRLLHVEPSERGAGLGSKLVSECVKTARAVGYRRLVLWTNDVLVAARRVYERAGFRLVSQEGHHSFGKDLHGQMWELDLA